MEEATTTTKCTTLSQVDPITTTSVDNTAILIENDSDPPFLYISFTHQLLLICYQQKRRVASIEKNIELIEVGIVSK